jgi:hypothetical protein
VGMSHIIADGGFTRSEHQTEHWGENLDVISCDGRSGAFYTMPKNGGTAMVSRSGRSSSLSYQNLFALIMIYSNNGCVYSDLNDKKRITMVGHVAMFWDGVLYQGSFNSFTVSEHAEKPFSIDYSFEYVVTMRTDTFGKK